jgi:hypothetical protein
MKMRLSSSLWAQKQDVTGSMLGQHHRLLIRLSAMGMSLRRIVDISGQDEVENSGLLRDRNELPYIWLLTSTTTETNPPQEGSACNRIWIPQLFDIISGQAPTFRLNWNHRGLTALLFCAPNIDRINDVEQPSKGVLTRYTN